MDLGIVDALARLELEARRAGLELTVRAPRDLVLLVAFCGLEEALGVVELQRQPEEREERRGVEEEAELDDASF